MNSLRGGFEGGLTRNCPGCNKLTIYQPEDLIGKLPLCPNCQYAHNRLNQVENKSTKEERDEIERENRKVRILDGRAKK